MTFSAVMKPSNATPSVFDIQSLTSLKARASQNDPQALKATARQFEALFLQTVLKSMRDATPHDGMFDSDQTRMYESLLDAQLAQVMSNSKNGTGLATMIERQLAQRNTPPEAPQGPLPLKPEAGEAIPLSKSAAAYALPQADVPLAPVSLKAGMIPLRNNRLYESDRLGSKAQSSTQNTLEGREQGNGKGKRTLTSPEALDTSSPQGSFAERMRPYAEAAETATGIPSQFMLAQAALESGWGKAEPRTADGTPSFNLFGIKAGRSWKGATVDASTQEYVNGKAQRQVGRFRAYDSYADAFADYANLIATNPRYRNVLASRDSVEFARALQSAGYATDPQYASKLERIMASPALRS